MNWKKFTKHCMKGGWVSPFRSKTIIALIKVVPKVPCSVPHNLTIYAPAPNELGCYFYTEDKHFVVLAADLEQHHQKYVNHAVAHELAHWYSRHWRTRLAVAEREANALATKWGFPPCGLKGEKV